MRVSVEVVLIEVRCPWCNGVAASVAVLTPGDRYHCANGRCRQWFTAIANTSKRVY